MWTTQSVNVAAGIGCPAASNWLAPAGVSQVDHIAARCPAGLGAFAPAAGASLPGLAMTATLPSHGVPPQYRTARATASATGLESTLGVRAIAAVGSPSASATSTLKTVRRGIAGSVVAAPLSHPAVAPDP